MPPFDKDEWVQLRFGSDLGHYSFIGKKMKGGFIVEARFYRWWRGEEGFPRSGSVQP